MRFINILFLALWQLTAIPFVAALTSYTMADTPASAPADSYTIVYKTAVIDAAVYDYH